MLETTIKEIVLDNMECLDHPYYNIIKTTGYEGLSTVLDTLGYGSVYIPKKSSIFKPCLEMYISKHGKKANFKALAKMFELTEKTVRNIGVKNAE